MSTRGLSAGAGTIGPATTLAGASGYGCGCGAAVRCVNEACSVCDDDTECSEGSGALVIKTEDSGGGDGAVLADVREATEAAADVDAAVVCRTDIACMFSAATPRIKACVSKQNKTKEQLVNMCAAREKCSVLV